MKRWFALSLLLAAPFANAESVRQGYIYDAWGAIIGVWCTAVAECKDSTPVACRAQARTLLGHPHANCQAGDNHGVLCTADTNGAQSTKKIDCPDWHNPQ
jgi:hypothetical protein